VTPQEIAHLKSIESAARRFVHLTRPHDVGSSRTWQQVAEAVDDLKLALDAYDALRRDPWAQAAAEGAWS